MYMYVHGTDFIYLKSLIWELVSVYIHVQYMYLHEHLQLPLLLVSLYKFSLL